MNERIEQLLKQATVVTEGWCDDRGTTRYYSVDHKKFAELIVRECAKRVDYWESRQGEHTDDILNHFGVEE